MKHEWRKKEKGLYLPKDSPQLIDVPDFGFLTINGQGNPNDEAFSKKIEALYAVAYAIRMMPKKGRTPEGYFEYTVYPLEGVWSLTDQGKKSKILDKEELVYTLMIRQPGFVTPELAQWALDHVRQKKKLALIDEVAFERKKEGLSVQILHVGSYDDEARSFKRIQAFIDENQLIRETLDHREIYLSDFRKTKEESLKTVLRVKVARQEGVWEKP